MKRAPKLFLPVIQLPLPFPTTIVGLYQKAHVTSAMLPMFCFFKLNTGGTSLCRTALKISVQHLACFVVTFNLHLQTMSLFQQTQLN